MKLTTFVSLLSLVVLCSCEPDWNIAHTPDLIRHEGYPAEEHFVTTDDNYVLGIHRIPHGKNAPTTKDQKPVVLLQHGLLCSSADWVILGPENSLAYLLADAGYDVWLGNARGNTYSRNHTKLDPSSAKFWDFSWHEMGIHDVPAVIDYIIKETGEQKIFYVGHSMGTTMFYVMGSLKPEYNNKIRAMFSLAPVSYLTNMKSPLLDFFAKFTFIGQELGKLFGVNEFLPSNTLLQLIGGKACQETSPIQKVCTNVLFLAAGVELKELNATVLPAILGHTPAGASTKSCFHYGQSYQDKWFAQYDYGLFGNLLAYNSAKPPAYDLTKVTAPVHLHYADNDWFGDPQDVDSLSNVLPNVASKVKVQEAEFSHQDFVWAIHVKELVNDAIISEMAKY